MHLLYVILVTSTLGFIMNSSPQKFWDWKVLCWNVRGLNADTKWNSVRDKIFESACDVICLQETKKNFFDENFIKNFCPPVFDAFHFLPSVGASGGIIIIWKSSLLDGTLASRMSFPSQCPLLLNSQMTNGYSLTFMVHLYMIEKESLCNG